MFVQNDCRADARVLRGGGDPHRRPATTSRSWHLPTDRKAKAIEREERDGFDRPSSRHVPLLPGAQLAARAGSAAWLPSARAPSHALVRSASRCCIGWSSISVVLAPPARPDATACDWLRCGASSSTAGRRAAARGRGPADVYHGHDLSGLLGGATYASTIHDQGRGRLVYDSHELFLESASNVNRAARRSGGRCGSSRRRWVRRCGGSRHRERVPARRARAAIPAAAGPSSCTTHRPRPRSRRSMLQRPDPCAPLGSCATTTRSSSTTAGSRRRPGPGGARRGDARARPRGACTRRSSGYGSQRDWLLGAGGRSAIRRARSTSSTRGPAARAARLGASMRTSARCRSRHPR